MLNVSLKKQRHLGLYNGVHYVYAKHQQSFIRIRIWRVSAWNQDLNCKCFILEPQLLHLRSRTGLHCLLDQAPSDIRCLLNLW